MRVNLESRRNERDSIEKRPVALPVGPFLEQVDDSPWSPWRNTTCSRFDPSPPRSFISDSRLTEGNEKNENDVIFLARNLFPIRYDGACTMVEERFFFSSSQRKAFTHGLPPLPRHVFRGRDVIVYRVFPSVPSLSTRNQQKHPSGSIIHTPSTALER